MIVQDFNSGWGLPYLRATASWACEQLGIAAQFPIDFRPGMGHGNARYRPVSFGDAWHVIVRLSRGRGSYPYVPLDPRVKCLHEWLRTHPVCPLRSCEEYLLFVLGHELWHLIDPFSCERRVDGRDADFHVMEQRCDEAGLRLVALSRETSELRERQERATSKQIAKPSNDLKELMRRVSAARRSG